jgi:hypothetical protein
MDTAAAFSGTGLFIHISGKDQTVFIVNLAEA